MCVFVYVFLCVCACVYLCVCVVCVCGCVYVVHSCVSRLLMSSLSYATIYIDKPSTGNCCCQCMLSSICFLFILSAYV